jgi:hypothetical protein
MLYFIDNAHRERFITALSQVKQIHNGRIDQDYGPAFYILTSHDGMWSRAFSHMDVYPTHALIDFEGMKEKEHLSSGERVLVDVAHNLFTHNGSVNLVECRLLDHDNFLLVLYALQVSYSAFDFAKATETR